MNYKIFEDSINMDNFVNEIKKNIKNEENLIIFDIGSKDGKDAKLLGKNFKNSKIYAFEAHPEEYEIYKKENSDINWINIAIYEYDGFIDFHIKNLNSGIHSIRDRGQIYGQNIINVGCCKISTFLKNNNLRAPDIVKIDVEGCSLEVLKSFEDNLKDVSFFHIETETEKYFKDQYLEDEVFTFLTNNNFEITSYSIADGLNQHDSIWINKNIFK